VDVNKRIEEQLKSHPILLYMKGTPDFPQCGFSGQAIAALKAVGKPFAYVNIFEDPEIREGLKAYSNWPTFPQLYVNGELIGGCEIMVEMYHSGERKWTPPPDRDAEINSPTGAQIFRSSRPRRRLRIRIWGGTG
jgi:monothiol glutaredoxin